MAEKEEDEGDAMTESKEHNPTEMLWCDIKREVKQCFKKGKNSFPVK